MTPMPSATAAKIVNSVAMKRWALELRVQVRVHGAQLHHRDAGIDARERGADRRRERQRIANRAEHERHAHPQRLERRALAHELLTVQRVDERLDVGLAAELPRVRDDAHDFARPLAILVVELERQALAERLLAGPELARERLVHHDDPRRVGLITGVEVAAAHQPGADRLEVVRRDHLVGREGRLADAGAPSSRNSTPGMPGQRRDHGAGGVHDAGHLLQRLVDAIDQERPAGL